MSSRPRGRSGARRLFGGVAGTVAGSVAARASRPLVRRASGGGRVRTRAATRVVEALAPVALGMAMAWAARRRRARSEAPGPVALTPDDAPHEDYANARRTRAYEHHH
ncbi:hypothetical protein [Actinomadura flavalba]|uniref:hypothetical protein n=1 Tax=Actinomadura flavalba TaxID=1120938 RepID=UPI000361CAEE|nr:hypothetical protein [Actinomadura flavalba]